MEDVGNKSISASPELKQMLAGLYGHMSKRLGIKSPPKIVFSHDKTNSKKAFGHTAYYSNQDKLVRVYITDRHPTDILRSFAHELIHHWQNEHGALPEDRGEASQAHYAQKDPVLRQREMEAYLLGNILFRDWQDENRYGPLNENIEVADPTTVQAAIRKTLFDLIKTGAIESFHRKATSGDMNPKDFVDELSRKLALEVNKFFQVMNNRGNWENQQYLVREGRLNRNDIKTLIKERIDKACGIPENKEKFHRWLTEYARHHNSY